ncbi:MAG: divalent-cation tolerance protein CutA [Thaumarchaeota archaeon]|nr:divalent-cation tolerance protein CutA [Nitrososphaerota archaeon]
MVAKIILSTYPSREEAKKAARGAVSGRLAACVNIVRIDSAYTWKGKIEEAEEFLAIYKTTTAKAAKLRKFIESKHSYEVPEIITLNISNVSEKYMQWLVESTK